MPDCPALLTTLLGVSSASSWNDSINILIQLATSMRAHARGGTLLVVPSKSESWRDSIIHPITYPVEPAFQGLTDLTSQDSKVRESLDWQSSMSRMVDKVAGYTAVDGATIITDKHALVAFGAKIQRSPSGIPVDRLMLTEPIIDAEVSIVHPSQAGGTRHISAALISVIR